MGAGEHRPNAETFGTSHTSPQSTHGTDLVLVLFFFLFWFCKQGLMLSRPHTCSVGKAGRQLLTLLCSDIAGVYHHTWLPWHNRKHNSEVLDALSVWQMCLCSVLLMVIPWGLFLTTELDSPFSHHKTKVNSFAVISQVWNQNLNPCSRTFFLRQGVCSLFVLKLMCRPDWP